MYIFLYNYFRIEKKNVVAAGEGRSRREGQQRLRAASAAIHPRGARLPARHPAPMAQLHHHRVLMFFFFIFLLLNYESFFNSSTIVFFFSEHSHFSTPPPSYLDVFFLFVN